MSRDEGRNRRERFRQDELLAIKEEFLTPEKFSAEMHKTGIVSQNASLMQELINNDTDPIPHGNSISSEITRALEALELKLDYLIAQNMGKADDTECDQRLISLSSSGIGFSTQERCNKGDRLKMRINLSLFPPVKLELLGKVVSISSESSNRSGTRIGVSFLYRCEQEEDVIIKYLFKRQRERIRAKYMRKSVDEEMQPDI